MPEESTAPNAPESPPEFVPFSKLPNFDPRLQPLVGVDSHLPALPAAVLTPQALRARFRQAREWSPEVRAEPRFSDRQLAQAAVLVAIVARDEPTVLLTQRTAHLSTHSGQIAFPGGRCDDTDADAVHTALREAHEEVGLAREHVQALGELPTYTTGTRYVVTPVVALVDPQHRLSLNAHEVADAFEGPLAFLMNPAHHRRHAVATPGGTREFFAMPYVQGGTERFIWGATAGMLRNLYRFLAA